MGEQQTCDLKVDAKFSDGAKIQSEFKNVPASVMVDIIELIRVKRTGDKTEPKT